MKLTVTIAGIYNDTNGHADFYEQGETLQTGERYGTSLLQDGYVIYHDPTYQAQPGTMPPSTMEKVTPEESADALSLNEASDFGSLSVFFEINNVTKEMVEALIELGISLPQDLLGLTDEQLMAIPGVTKTMAKAMRKKAVQ